MTVKTVKFRRDVSHSMRAIRITHNEFTADEIWALYRKEHDGRMKERYHVIALMLEGWTAPQVAKFLHLVRNTPWEWATMYNDKGLDGLKRTSPPGMTPQLSKEQLAMLEADLEKEPQELGYDFPRWTGKTVAYHVGVKYGAKIGERMAQKWVKRLGFTQQVPEQQHADADPAVQAQFLVEIKKKSPRLEQLTRK
jgi:transposase